MNCTATTRLTAAECLARLADCPALPRGERLATYAAENPGRVFGARTWHIRLVLGETVAQEVALGIGGRACFSVHPRWFRDWAAPVRRLREERRALRREVALLRSAMDVASRKIDLCYINHGSPEFPAVQTYKFLAVGGMADTEQERRLNEKLGKAGLNAVALGKEVVSLWTELAWVAQCRRAEMEESTRLRRVNAALEAELDAADECPNCCTPAIRIG